MSRAAPIHQGFDFQARIFWWHAASLLIQDSGVVRVGQELPTDVNADAVIAPKWFDDLYVEYADGFKVDASGAPIRRDFIQCKWHMRGGDYGYQDLIDPAFTGTRRSLLERVRDAVDQGRATAGDRLVLVTNWFVRQGDPLNKIIRRDTECLDLTCLRQSKTVHKAWQQALQVDAAGLDGLLRLLVFKTFPPSLETHQSWLDDRLARAGLQAELQWRQASLFDDVARKWGRCLLDRTQLRNRCQAEKLFAPVTAAPTEPPSYGIRTRLNTWQPLEDRCARVLDLAPEFAGRYIRDTASWNTVLVREMVKFLNPVARREPVVRLILDVHTSLAFAAGAILDTQVGRPIQIVQRTFTGTMELWSADDRAEDATWCGLDDTMHRVEGAQGDDMALAIGLTHDPLDAVKEHVTRALPQVGRILGFLPTAGASNISVQCGRHALRLATQVVTAVARASRGKGGRAPRLHLFIAAPNTFTFFLGRLHRSLGEVVTYEWDFEGSQTYSPAVTIPAGDVTGEPA